jgi:hypothetical protein
MTTMKFVLHEPVWSGALTRSADALLRSDAATGRERDSVRATASPSRSLGFFERVDRWFWRQSLREREKYLAGSHDIFELEERIRRLDRRVGSRYY